MDVPKWWQKAVFYQIYPRSFADSNGDGIGDFPGITAKLDYLRDLGIDAIWLSPHYPSPFLDCGYDVSDYMAVAPEYGSLDSFKRFLREAHTRGIRVILDLVLNHTSHMHPWFVSSCTSLDNPMRDWYVWENGNDGGPPNNWESAFGGSAWELDSATGQYYYHMFLKEQPDLNWRNPAVKAAMWDAVRFWLDMGVDGFRLDAISTIFEHPDMPDHQATRTHADLFHASIEVQTDEERERINKDYGLLFHYQTQQPGLHELMQELRALVDEYPGDRVLVGEEEDVAYHGSGDNELHLVFNFPLMRVGRLTAEHIRTNQSMRLEELPEGAWPCNTLGNHDTSRVWTRYGDGTHDAELARLHIAMLLTLKGTPFLYNGEEIGMTDLELTHLDCFRDTMATAQYARLRDMGTPHEEALKAVAATTRDRCRTPLQWSNSPNAGFSPPGVETWLPINPNHVSGTNVRDQSADPSSLLNFYRRMLRIRRDTPALVTGSYTPIEMENKSCLTFLRQDENTRCLVALNLSPEEQGVALSQSSFGGDAGPYTVLFSSHAREGQASQLDTLLLAPFEIFIARVA